MQQSDIQILELLANGDEPALKLRPADIAANIGYSKSTVQSRVGDLRRAGLIEYSDQVAGRYRIAALGEQYLAGSLTDQQIDDIEAALA